MDSGINIFSSKSRRSQGASSPSDDPSNQRKRSSLIPPPPDQSRKPSDAGSKTVLTAASMPSQPASRAASVSVDPKQAAVPSGASSVISLKTALGPAQAPPPTAPSLISLKTALGTAPATATGTNPAEPEKGSSTTSHSTSSSKISPKDTSKLPRNKPTFLIGISGAPASGKTSLALLLSLLLPSSQPVFVIHQDDYRIPKHLRVPNDNDEAHLNAYDAVDFATFKKLLQYAKREGQLPNAFKTAHDEPTERERAEMLIGEKDWKSLKHFVAKTIGLKPGCTFGIVEGPLLFHDPEIRALLDVKLFIWASMEIARIRWLDAIACGNYKVEGVPSWLTRDHFDRIMWRNYFEDTKHLFHRGDVAGVVHVRVCNGLGIRVQPKIDSALKETMHWAVDMVMNDVDNFAHDSAKARRRRRRSSVEEPEGGWRWAAERVRRVLYKLV
ncbi:ribosylnicotinamide kinase [Trapelia coarctata]|nr:ribosylnicotinamide kinase [Trapelia coarctata]